MKNFLVSLISISAIYGMATGKWYSFFILLVLIPVTIGIISLIPLKKGKKDYIRRMFVTTIVSATHSYGIPSLPTEDVEIKFDGNAIYFDNIQNIPLKRIKMIEYHDGTRMRRSLSRYVSPRKIKVYWIIIIFNNIDGKETRASFQTDSNMANVLLVSMAKDINRVIGVEYTKKAEKPYEV